jgi:hypothetical protein
VDGNGAEQTAEVTGTFPNGAGGYDGEQVTVKKG